MECSIALPSFRPSDAVTAAHPKSKRKEEKVFSRLLQAVHKLLKSVNAPDFLFAPCTILPKYSNPVVVGWRRGNGGVSFAHERWQTHVERFTSHLPRQLWSLVLSTAVSCTLSSDCAVFELVFAVAVANPCGEGVTGQCFSPFLPSLNWSSGRNLKGFHSRNESIQSASASDEFLVANSLLAAGTCSLFLFLIKYTNTSFKTLSKDSDDLSLFLMLTSKAVMRS